MLTVVPVTMVPDWSSGGRWQVVVSLKPQQHTQTVRTVSGAGAERL